MQAIAAKPLRVEADDQVGTGGDWRVMLKRFTDAMRHSSHGGRQASTSRLDHRVREALYRQCPEALRGISKHAGDAVKQGFRIVKRGEKAEHRVNDEFQAWWEDVNGADRVRRALIDAHVHGDGYLELEYDDSALSNAAASGDLVDLHVVDPVPIDLIRQEDDGITREFLKQRNPGGRDVVLHPDRFHHLRINPLSGNAHGLSTIEVAHHAAIAIVKGDQGIGEVLYFSGVSKVLGMLGPDATDDEIVAVTAMLNDPDFVRGFVWKQDGSGEVNFQQLNPVMGNVEPYFDRLSKGIAAGVGLPVALLHGVAAGAVTGSEVNLHLYFQDVNQFQQNTLTPLIKRLVAAKTGADPASFQVEWSPFPNVPGMEATMRRDQAQAWQVLVSKGVKPLAAARIVGLELNEEDMEEKEPVPDGLIPAVTGDPEPGDDEGGDAPDGGAAPPG